jgi:hypothetical protein
MRKEKLLDINELIESNLFSEEQLKQIQKIMTEVKDKDSGLRVSTASLTFDIDIFPSGNMLLRIKSSSEYIEIGPSVY